MVEPPCGRPEFGKIADEGADDAALVDTVMLEETPVLGGDERLLHQVRNLGERDPDPPIARLEYVGEIGSFAVKHRAHARQLAALEPRLVREIGSRVVIELDDLANIDDRLVDALILAELVISGVQVGEIDAVKGFDFDPGGL